MTNVRPNLPLAISRRQAKLVGIGVSLIEGGAVSLVAVIADTIVPEAFEATHDYAGFITVAGFLAAFALSKLGDPL